MNNLITIFVLSVLLSGCLHGGGGGAPAPMSSCGDTTINTYTMSWDKVVDADLNGYDVHYKIYDASIPLNKSNGTKFTALTETFLIDPISLSLTTCDVIELGVVALGTVKSSSSLSTTALLTVD